VGGKALEIRVAWRRDDPEIEADAVQFWTRLGLLPSGVSPEERAKELVCVAYADGRLIAVGTAAIEHIPQLRANFAVIRGATDPDYRRLGAMWALAEPVRATLEQWAIDNPEERLAGRLGFVEHGAWGELAKMPVVSRLMLFGYTAEGRQIRGDWFDHFRFD
jgi:GNAT superfamily N-acetyltransferase